MPYFFSDGIIWIKEENGLSVLNENIVNKKELISLGQMIVDLISGNGYIYNGETVQMIGGGD